MAKNVLTSVESEGTYLADTSGQPFMVQRPSTRAPDRPGGRLHAARAPAHVWTPTVHP